MHKDRFGPLVLNLVIAETCLFVAIMLVLDFFRYRQFAAKPNNMLEENGKSQLMANNVQIIQDLRSGLSIAKLKDKYPGRNIMIFQSKVYDLGSYIHPGGQFIFEECRWREVSRFLHGAVGLERFNGSQWKHSTQAFSALASCHIGDLLAVGPGGSDVVLRDAQGHPFVSDAKTAWFLDSRKMVSPTTAVLQFKSQGLKVKLACKGLDWMGRHFTVSDN